MPAWNELLEQFDGLPDENAKALWLRQSFLDSLAAVSALRSNRNVILYGSSFLQKPGANAFQLQITSEDINGFMSTMFGMTWANNLTLILHTPGGATNATETLVAYLHSKFSDIEVIVPTYAMSAGTMISLASNRVIMGRQSQLGPIDPQLFFNGRPVSAQAIVAQFESARAEIVAEIRTAHAWAPVLQSLGPALLQEAQMASDYSEEMVGRWLAGRMFNSARRAKAKTKAKAKTTAKYFNSAASHKSHGRRIDRDEARSVGVIVEDLENDQNLQEAVLTGYHLMTMIFEKTPAARLIATNSGRMWVKNLA